MIRFPDVHLALEVLRWFVITIDGTFVILITVVIAILLDMLQYPGIRLSASETDVRQGSALSPNHQSAYDNAIIQKWLQYNRAG